MEDQHHSGPAANGPQLSVLDHISLLLQTFAVYPPDSRRTIVLAVGSMHSAMTYLNKIIEAESWCDGSRAENLRAKADKEVERALDRADKADRARHG